ncbi:MAG: DUF393 domain-containing protein [Acidimicrobiales bacterium]|nr:DUF393 domain-containing protein [Acidimicrobiales bacterium]
MEVNIRRVSNTSAYVFYDQECQMCRGMIHLIQILFNGLNKLARVKSNIDWVPFCAPIALGVLSNYDEPTRYSSFVVMSSEGEVTRFGNAVFALLQELPFGKRFIESASKITFLSHLVDNSYRFVASHRSQFGRLIPASLAQAVPSNCDDL